QCYLAALKQDRNLKGDVTIRFLLLANGVISTVDIEEATLIDPDVHRCISEKVMQMKFPAIPLQFVSMRYTFSFTPPKDEKFEFNETAFSGAQRKPGGK